MIEPLVLLGLGIAFLYVSARTSVRERRSRGALTPEAGRGLSGSGGERSSVAPRGMARARLSRAVRARAHSMVAASRGSTIPQSLIL